MIEAQKHEKRYRELELLAKLERLQAERLKKLVLEDSSSMLDSYFDQSNSSYLDKDSSLDLDKLEAAVDKLKFKNRRQSEFIRPKSNLEFSLPSDSDSVIERESPRLSFNKIKKSQVEVLNLKNTTIHQQPKSVFVVKENEIKKRTENKELKHAISLSNQEVKTALKNVQSEPVLKPSRTRTRTLSNKHQFEMPSSSSSSSFTQMTLQDAFMTFKKDLIMRSQKRVKEIEERSQLRNEKAEYERGQAQMNLKLREAQKRLFKQTSITQAPRRRLSSQEIKTITKKNYEKLPEVKQRQQKEKNEQAKKLNLIKSSIYKKTIQQHVLAKGPNFDLKYKAFDF